jgi:hypothetical protein
MTVANERFTSKSAGPSLLLIEALYSTFSGVHMPTELNSLPQHPCFGIDPNQGRLGNRADMVIVVLGSAADTADEI